MVPMVQHDGILGSILGLPSLTLICGSSTSLCAFVLDVDSKASEFAALKVPWRQAAPSSPSLEFSWPTSDATTFA